KSRPSRMRLATFRITLESSTTRHVLISASACSISQKGCFHCNSSLRTLPAILCRQHVRCDFEHAVDVEYDHELTVEAMYHAGDLARRQRHARQPLRHEHVLDARDRQPEQLAADYGGHVFGNGANRGFGLAGHGYFLMPPG